MKKNKMMRIASVLLVAVLMTTCIISGTFAKYVTTGTASDSARVAKWGVTVEAAGTNKDDLVLFKANYDDTVVSADATARVVAPGTAATMTQFVVSGSPEVDVKVSYAGSLTLTGWTITAGEYCPLVITVGSTSYKIGDAGISTVSDLQAAVNDAIAAFSQTYDANTDLSTKVAEGLSVSWSWAYEGDDVKDTALGDLGTAPTIALSVTATITQVD